MPSRFSVLLLSGYLLAASTSVFSAALDTPLTIFQLAEKNDAEIRAAFASLQAEREKKNQSTGALFPQIALRGDVAANREDIDASTATNTGETSYDSYDVALTLRQAVYRRDLFNELDITDSNILVAESEYKAAQQELITRVLEKFFKGLAARDNLEFLESERKAIEEQLIYTKKRYKVGKTTVTDYLEAQAAFDLADAEVISAQDLLRDTLDAIEQMTGVKPKTLAPLGKNFEPITPDPANAEQWVIEAEKSNPGLIAARYQVQAAKYEVERYKSGHYPRFDVVARYGTEKTGGRFGDSTIDDASIALELEFPLYTGGQTSSRVREAYSRLEEAQEEMLGTHRAVIRETKKVYRNTVTALNRIKALNVAVKSTKTAVKSIKAGYRAGTRTNADLLRAQRELFKAKLDYEAAKYQYTANYFQLKNITGKLTKEDVELINAWFDI